MMTINNDLEAQDSRLNVSDWIRGIRGVVEKALQRQVDVDIELLPTRMVLHITVPDGDKLLGLARAIDYAMLRRNVLSEQAQIQAEAGIILDKFQAFLAANSPQQNV